MCEPVRFKVVRDAVIVRLKFRGESRGSEGLLGALSGFQLCVTGFLCTLIRDTNGSSKVLTETDKCIWCCVV